MLWTDPHTRECWQFVPARPRPAWLQLALGAALLVVVIVVGGLYA